jgi:hypothetical protein
MPDRGGMNTITTDGATRQLSADAMAALVRSMQLMADGSRAEFDEVVHPDAVNREGKDEPPEARGAGPAAFYASALWLREWFSDLAFEVHEVVVDCALDAHLNLYGRSSPSRRLPFFPHPDGHFDRRKDERRRC